MLRTKSLIAMWAGLVLCAAVSVAQQAPASEPAAEPTAVAAQQTTPEPPAPQQPAATTAVQPATQTVAEGAAAAARESAGTLAEGGRSLAEQGRDLWNQILLPMWQRLAAAMPSIIKAILVLAIFWVVAVLAGVGVRKALGLTRLDNRAVEDWGLGTMLTRADGKPRSIERLASNVVKWIILLFGFVAFFQALNLAMVAGPLQRIVTEIVGVVPNLLQAALILLVFWVIAALLRLATTRGLQAVGFDERAARYLPEPEAEGEVVPPSGLVGRLTFYVVLLLGLPAFLDALGQRALVAPLSEMLERVFGFLPNIVAAAIIFGIGHVIATIVREILSNFLAAAGADAGVQRLGLGGALEKLKISEIAGSIAYFFIIVPVIGAAVESLGIRAISQPVTATLETLLAAVPLLFVAAVVAGVGYFLARIVSQIVGSFLEGVGFDLLPEKLGLEFLRGGEAAKKPSAIAANVVMVVIVLLTLQQALATLALTQLSDLIGRLVGYLPQLFVALVVTLAALSLSAWAARLVTGALGEQGHGRILAPVTRYAILFFGFGIALNELGIGESLVTVAVGSVLGGTALALGLAFGLGGKERAQRLIEETEAS